MTGRVTVSRTAVAAAGLVFALLAVVPVADAAAAPVSRARPTGQHASHAARTPIRHFLVLMQENHTFDNYFGTYPGADGIPQGVCMPVDPDRGRRPCVRPFHIGQRSVVDLDHSTGTALDDLDKGRMNGFVSAQRPWSNRADLAMGYYDGSDLPFYWNMADRYVLFDHFFSSALGGSFVNHVFWTSAAGVERLPARGISMPTIFDRLQKAGVSWKFYVQNYNRGITYRTLPRLANPNRASQAVWVPLLDMSRFLDRPALRSHIVDLSKYYQDLRKGTLPQVAYIVPSGASEHPPGSLKTGQQFVRGLVNTLMSSTAWRSSAFMVAYDDWGGWYDHVRPPRRGKYGDGFRVPALLVSPYARQHAIVHTRADFTSILKFIEHNWNVRPLTRLDARAGSLLGAFDFRKPPRTAEIIPLTRGPGHVVAKPDRGPVLYALYGTGAAAALAGMLAGWRLSRRRLAVVPEDGEPA